MAASREQHPSNVPGPFYVENGCCTACGVPEFFAPEFFGADNHAHCYVKRQPRTATEEDAVLRILATQDLDCIRYRGNDVRIRRRVAEMGEGSQCDVPLPAGMVSVRRDHASFLCVAPGERLTAHTILDRLVSYLSKQSTDYRTTTITENDAGASLTVSWFEDNFHRVDLLTPVQTNDRFTIRHLGPPRFSDTLHDWLVADELFSDARWQTQAQWEDAGAWHHAPW